MRYKGLDLNLVVACGVIMETGSVSRAADRLHLSQPAVSSALTRLRAYFNDPLFVVRGRRLVPTPLAESLRPFVQDCLRAADMMMRAGCGFDSATSRRVFRIAASDYATVALLSPAVPALARAAPGIRIDFMSPTDDDLDSLESGELDLIVRPDWTLSRDHPTSLLVEEQHVVVGWEHSPLMEQEIDAETFFSSDHVMISLGAHRRPSFAEQHLQTLERQRRIVAVVQSFLSVPWLLIGTDRLAVIPSRLAMILAGRLEIKAAPLPLPLAPMREMMQFHRANANDEALMWLIGSLKAMAGEQE